MPKSRFELLPGDLQPPALPTELPELLNLYFNLS